MDIPILSEIALWFRQSALGWPDVYAPFMEQFLFKLILLQMSLLLILHASGMDIAEVFALMIRLIVSNAFSLIMVRRGWHWVDMWFEGAKGMSYVMGSPAPDPSAIAKWGWVITDPIVKSLAKQGVLFFSLSPVSWVFGLGASFFLQLAFAILAFMQMAALVTSYFLIALCPWFFAFWGLSFTRSLTMSYVQMVLGTMTGLFTIQLMVAVVNEFGAQLEMWMRTTFLAEKVTLTAQHYAMPLVAGVVLCCLFVFLPYLIISKVGGVMGDWVGGLSIFRAANMAVATMSRMGGGGGGQHQDQGQGGGGSGSAGQGRPLPLPAPSQGASQQQSTQRSGAWGRRS